MSIQLVPGVDVRITGDGKGKGLFATRNFAAGEIIFEEKPLVCCQFSWNKAYKYLACDLCMRPLETAEENARRLSGKLDLELPFPECCPTNKATITRCPACGVFYCSEACRAAAWNQHHQALCLGAPSNPGHPLEQLEETWKQMHYPPETASVMLLARMLATVTQAADKEAAIGLFMQFCQRTENDAEQISHRLLGDQYVDQLRLLRDLACRALDADPVNHWLTEEGFRAAFALLGTNGQGVGTSPIARWVENVSNLTLSDDDRRHVDEIIDKLYEDMDQASGEFLNSEGSALYALQSCANHSCAAAAEVTFPHGDSTLVLVAREAIGDGEEICICYLDECARNRSRHSRRKELRENYLFSCECTMCQSQADEPDETSEEESEDEDSD